MKRTTDWRSWSRCSCRYCNSMLVLFVLTSSLALTVVILHQSLCVSPRHITVDGTMCCMFSHSGCCLSIYMYQYLMKFVIVLLTLLWRVNLLMFNHKSLLFYNWSRYLLLLLCIWCYKDQNFTSELVVSPATYCLLGMDYLDMLVILIWHCIDHLAPIFQNKPIELKNVNVVT